MCIISQKTDIFSSSGWTISYALLCNPKGMIRRIKPERGRFEKGNYAK